MATFGPADDLRGARFVGVDLSGAVMRGVQVQSLEIEAPWLFDGDEPLLVNGVDVRPCVDAELDRRFPGRSDRRAEDPEGLQRAWQRLQEAWTTALDRAATMPPDAVDISVAGEWSFAQTLRHLVLATDVWLRRAIQEVEQPFHPLGVAHAEAEENGLDMSLFRTQQPTYGEVLEARAHRVAMVGEFLTQVTKADLAESRKNPWAPQHPETVRSCLHTILEEEWEHLRYATRDLDVIELATAPSPDVDPSAVATR